MHENMVIIKYHGSDIFVRFHDKNWRKYMEVWCKTCEEFIMSEQKDSIHIGHEWDFKRVE